MENTDHFIINFSHGAYVTTYNIKPNIKAQPHHKAQGPNNQPWKKSLKPNHEKETSSHFLHHHNPRGTKKLPVIVKQSD